MMTPADVCEAIVYCNTIPWGKVGAVVAALALTYGMAMSMHSSSTYTDSEVNA